MIHQIDSRSHLYRIKRRIHPQVKQIKFGNVTIIESSQPIEIDATIQVLHTPRRTIIQFVIARPRWTRIPGKPPHVRKLRYVIESIYDTITIQYARETHLPNMARIENIVVNRILETRKETQNERTYRN